MRQLIYSLAVVLSMSAEAAAQNAVRLYVPNQGGNTIGDYTVPAVGGTLTPGTGFSGVFAPFAVAVTPDQRWAYVTQPFTDEVGVINTATNAIVQTVSSLTEPRGLAVSPDGSQLWVANRTSDTITTYSINATTGFLTSSGAPIAASFSGSLPRGLAFSPSGAIVYVANEVGGIDVINVATRSIAANVPLPGGEPKYVVFHPTLNRAFVSDGNIGIRVFDTTTHAQTGTLTTSLVSSEGLAVTPDGKWLYVASFGNNSVVAYDATTLAFLNATPGLSNPMGVVVMPNSSAVFVTNSLANNISHFQITAATGALTSAVTAPAGPSPQHPGMCRTTDGTFAAGKNFTLTLDSYLCISPNSNFTGGTLTAAAGLGIPAHMVISAGGMNIDTPGFVTTLSGGLSGAGPLTITGTVAGGVDLNVTNTNTGPTTVTGTWLRVFTPASTSPSSAITVQGGGTLAGNGTVGGPVTLSASSIRPGILSTGILTVGNLSLPAGNTLFIKLNGVTAGTEHDRLDVNGTVTLGGTLTPSLGFVPAGGQVFTILQNDGTDAISGTFAGRAEGSTINISGGVYRISYVGGTGNDVTLTRLVFPSVSTAASAATTVGNPIRATATISAGNNPTGTVTFRLYAPGDTNCTGGAVFTDTKAVAGPGAYTSSDFTAAAVGTFKWIASYNGDALNGSTFNECNTPGSTVAVSQASQTITFNGLSGKTFGDAPFVVSATASSSLAVTFQSLTTSVCTMSASTVTLVAAGTCTIAADQAGDGSYNAATQVLQSFSVAKANQTITFGALADKTLGDAAFTVGASASSGLGVTFSSTTTAVCTVASSTVTMAAGGTCTIAADQAGNANYLAAARVQQSFTVASGCSVSISPANLAPGLGGIPFNRTLTLTGATGAVTWSLTGALPAGVTFANGVFSGTPAARGAFPVTVTATDANSCQGSTSYTTSFAAERRLVVGAGPGGSPTVRAFNIGSGTAFADFSAFGSFNGGVSVASGDVNGDGVADIITAAGPGGAPHVKVFDGVTNQTRVSFFAFEPTFTGGVSVAAGDVTGDGTPEILAGPGCGGPSVVRAFDGATGALVREYAVAASVWSCGLNVAAGDVNGDGRADIIAGSGGLGPPFAAIVDGATGVLLRELAPYTATFTGGVAVAAGDVNGDGFADVITGAGPGAAPRVRVFDGATGAQLPGPLGSFDAFTGAFVGGVRVGAADLNGDGQAELITGAGPGGGPHVRVWDGATGAELYGLYALDTSFSGGVFVAGAAPSGRMWIDIASGTGGQMRVAGWALREGAITSTGTDAIHVWAYPVSGASPVFVGAAPARTARPDVATAFGGEFLMAGFDFTGTLAPGTYDLIVFARNSRTLRFDQARVVRVTVQ